MQPIPFKEMNTMFAKDQTEYTPLPAYRDEEVGCVVSRWQATFLERLQVLIFGKIWVNVLVFDHPLQPMMIQTAYPFKDRELPHD